jgi:hypothetical protein
MNQEFLTRHGLWDIVTYQDYFVGIGCGSIPWVREVCGISEHPRASLAGMIESSYQQCRVPCGGFHFVCTTSQKKKVLKRVKRM